MTGVVRWTLTDPVTSEIYQFARNPSEGGTPSLTKNLTTKVTTASDGNVILFEGRRQPQEGTFKGHILAQSEMTDLTHWANKTNQVYLTDDLARVFCVYIQDVQFTRVRSATYDWKHTYELKYTIISWS